MTSSAAPFPQRQRGVTLIELLVGLIIGLLTVAVAMGALMVSRGVSGTVSDASEIQQQGSYAMRVIGQQIRQAGSLKLDLFPSGAMAGASDTLEHVVPVALEARTPPSGSDAGWDPATDTVGFYTPSGKPGGPIFGFASFTEKVTTGAAPEYQAHQAFNCLGRAGTTVTRSNFRLQDGVLRCGDGGADDEPIVRNVAAFQVRYVMQDITTTPGIPQVEYVASHSAVESATNGWAKVQAVEVCLELYGNEPLDLPAGSTYTGCSGPVAYSTLTGERARRLHLAFRSVFQLRGQGQTGAVL